MWGYRRDDAQIFVGKHDLVSDVSVVRRDVPGITEFGGFLLVDISGCREFDVVGRTVSACVARFDLLFANLAAVVHP
jgi:hypothetical protein